MTTERIDPLAVIRKHAAAHVALATSDAYSAQEAPRLLAAASAVAELVEAAREVADEHMGLAATDIYHHEGDEVGTRACCGVVSYADHASDCPAVRLRAALAAFGRQG